MSGEGNGVERKDRYLLFLRIWIIWTIHLVMNEGRVSRLSELRYMRREFQEDIEIFGSLRVAVDIFECGVEKNGLFCIVGELSPRGCERAP